MVWNRVKFEQKKKEMIKDRREALKGEDMEKWRQIYQEMAALDEECLQDVLEQILARVGLTEKLFQASLNLHMDDGSKTGEIKEVQEDATVDRGEGRPADYPERQVTLDKKEAITLQKKMQSLSVNQIRELKAMPPAALQSEIIYLPSILQDKFFLATGVETDELNFNTDKLELEKDEEYTKSLEEYHEQVE